MTELRPDRCTTCRYLDRHIITDDPVPFLTCRRYPPQVITHDDGEVCEAWPEIMSPGEDSWCGEWAKDRPKPTSYAVTAAAVVWAVMQQDRCTECTHWRAAHGSHVDTVDAAAAGGAIVRWENGTCTHKFMVIEGSCECPGFVEP